MPQSAKTKRAKNKRYYQDNVDKIRTQQRVIRARNVEGRKHRNRSYYLEHQEKKKATARANSKAKYANNPDIKRSISRANSKAEYSANREN